jgi:hypothetical protein
MAKTAKKVVARKVATNKSVAKPIAKKSTKVVAKKDNSFETKTKKVANHLVNKSSITSWDAINLYKATRLSAIIFNLKKRGFIISTTMEENNNATFARYKYMGTKPKAKSTK